MITTYIDFILLVTGLMTTLAIAMFFAPRRGLRLLFGDERAEQGALFVARHWGLLVALIGALLVTAAYEPGLRVPVMAQWPYCTFCISLDSEPAVARGYAHDHMQNEMPTRYRHDDCRVVRAVRGAGHRLRIEGQGGPGVLGPALAGRQADGTFSVSGPKARRQNNT